MPSLNHEKFANIAAEQAVLSPVGMQVGCAAVLNGRVIAKGYNHYRSKSRDRLMNNSFTCHAECHVLHQIINQYGHDTRKLSKVVQDCSDLYC